MPEKHISIDFNMAARTRRDGRYEGVLSIEGRPEVYVTQPRKRVEHVARDLERRAGELLHDLLEELPLSE